LLVVVTGAAAGDEAPPAPGEVLPTADVRSRRELTEMNPRHPAHPTATTVMSTNGKVNRDRLPAGGDGTGLGHDVGGGA
jgi:hypothetical protein